MFGRTTPVFETTDRLCDSLQLTLKTQVFVYLSQPRPLSKGVPILYVCNKTKPPFTSVRIFAFGIQVKQTISVQFVLFSPLIGNLAVDNWIIERQLNKISHVRYQIEQCVCIERNRYSARSSDMTQYTSRTKEEENETACANGNRRSDCAVRKR